LSFANHGVWKYLGTPSTPNNWQNVAPADDIASMAVDGTGSLYVLNFAKQCVWKYLGTPGNWQNVAPEGS
jgi:hypothetical protein